MWPDWSNPLLATSTTHTLFNQLLIYVNLYQHAKNQANWFVLKILIKKSCNLIDWEHVAPYLRNKNPPAYGRTQQIIKFHYRTKSVKINDQIFQQIKKILFSAHFSSIFPVFEAKTFFPKYFVLSRTIL